MKKKIEAHILIVDDEPAIRRAFKDSLEYEPYEVDVAIDGEDCLLKIKDKDYDIIFLDVRMPQKDGFECLKLITPLCPDTNVVMFSGQGDKEMMRRCFKNGAADYIEKPLDLFDTIATIREILSKKAKLKKAFLHLSTDFKNSNIQDIIGESSKIHELKDNIKANAPFDKEDVLILGENGSGKELVAQWVHAFSPRRKAPFIEVNCAAITPTLIESTLFGHVKGAFTDAKEDKKGKFEEADGGTLFLDEIGDMSLDVQAAILRALETKSITRLGTSKTIKVNVRIVAATNKNLENEVKMGHFRRDLLYRLERLRIYVPLLNERTEDIPLLVEHFRQEFYRDYPDAPQKVFSNEALAALQNQNWPGNVRQLRNATRQLLIYTHTKAFIIESDDVFSYFKNRV
jgi:two-component system, NtrC family, nitrogen regulation response regulator NtrX